MVENSIVESSIPTKMKVCLDDDLRDYTPKHWTVLAFLFEQTWLSTHGQNTTNYQQLLVLKWLARALHEGPDFKNGGINIPYPDRANARTRDGEITDTHQMNPRIPDRFTQIGFLDQDATSYTDWDEIKF